MDISDAGQPKNEFTFPVIGIGASAGGLPPFESILRELPSPLRAAIVFIQHLLPDRKSLLGEILRAKFPSLDIAEISDGAAIESGRIYVNAPDREVSIHNGRFRLSPLPKRGLHLPIDSFFTSLAENVQDKAVAAVLSGAGTDGVRGVREVQCKGGVVLAQEPSGAEFWSMPAAAIETGCVDETLAPVDLGRHLAKLIATFYNVPAADELLAFSQLEMLFNILHEKAGFRFEEYKRKVVARRVQRRMSLYGLSSIQEYVDLVNKKPHEIGQLASDMMIGVTAFFRDAGAWESLRTTVVQKLAADKKPGETIRVWAPACSTGEETYSIAMMFLLEIERAGKRNDLHVFASDINEASLAKAREGKYAGNVTADIPSEYVKAYFSCLEDGTTLQINKHVRDHIVFAKQNILSDPPFSKLDLVICRNLLIYLEQPAQEKCISIFHYALKEDGFLFLGNAESVGRQKSLFKSLGDKKCRMYKRLAQNEPVRYHFPTSAAPAPVRQGAAPQTAASAERNVTEFAHELLLSLYAPASVMINSRYEILYTTGALQRFVQPPAGEFSADFISWIPDESRNRLRGGLYSASQDSSPIAMPMNLAGPDGTGRTVTLRIQRYNHPVDKSALFLVVFEDSAPGTQEPQAILASDADKAAIRQMERELSVTRDELQTNIEELKSANEEMQSSNEELQAANEEMETSREELQSLNEELLTVNAQLQGKIEEQEVTNNDLSNFFSSTDIPTLFLDVKMGVKRYTPSIKNLIKLIPTDIGRPIADFSLENLGPDLVENAETVLETLVPVKREIAVGESWYIRTVLPYRTTDNRIEGTVVTFVDITGRKLDEEKLAYQAHLLANAHDAVMGLDADFVITYWNKSAWALYGWTAQEAIGRKSFDILQTVYVGSTLEETSTRLKAAGHCEFEALHRTKDGRQLSVDVRSAMVADAAGNPTGYISTCRDLTERKRMEEEIRTLARFPSENPNPILRISKDGAILYANEASGPLMNMWGCITGGTVPDPFGQEIVHAFAADTRGMIEIECEGRFYSFVVIPIAQAGYVNLYGRDVTVHKMAEEALRESHRQNEFLAGVIESSSQPFAVGYPDGRLGLCNKAFQELTGYSDVELHSIDWAKELTPPEWVGIEQKKLEELHATGRPVRYEKEYIRKNGARVPIELLVHMVKGPDGKPLYYYSFLSDITERKLAEAALTASEARYRTTMDKMLEGCQIIGRDWKYVYINEAAQRHNRRPSSELIGNRYMDMWPGIQSTHVFEVIKRCIEERAPETLENEFVFPDGTVNCFDLSVQPVPEGVFILSVDITERKRAEKVLAFQAQLLSEVHDAVFSSDRNFTITYWNQAAEKMFGWTKDEVLGKRIDTLNLIYPEDIPIVNRTMERLSGGKERTVVSSNRNITKGGAVIDCTWHNSVLVDDKGQMSSVMSLVQDVSERKNAEAALRESEQRYRHLVQYAPAGIYEVDFATGRFTEVNDVMCRILGYSREELLAITAFDILDDEGKVRFAARIRDAQSGKPPAEAAEYRVRTKDGRFIWGLLNIKFLWDKDKIVGATVVAHDVTDRKSAEEALRQSEARFRALTTAASDAIYRMSPDWSEMRQLNGRDFLADTDKPNSNWITSYVHPDDQSGLKAVVDEAIRKKQPFELEHRILRADGTWGWTSSRAIPLLDEKGEIVEWFGAADDISERKQLEEHMLRYVKELAVANKELESFSYSISHDLRAPLRAMKGFSSLLLKDYAEKLHAEGRDFLNRINTAADKMGELIDDMLSLSKISRQEMNLQEGIDLSEIAGHVITTLRQAEPHRNVDVDIEQGLKGTCDARLMNIVLSNLIGNAWKYTGKTPLAKIEFGVVEQNGETAYYVRDNGAGFDMTQAHRMFAPFQRLHSESQFPGTGIGLSIVNKIIQRYGSRIWAEGETGKGAAFYFTLPVHKSGSGRSR